VCDVLAQLRIAQDWKCALGERRGEGRVEYGVGHANASAGKSSVLARICAM